MQRMQFLNFYTSYLKFVFGIDFRAQKAPKIEPKRLQNPFGNELEIWVKLDVDFEPTWRPTWAPSWHPKNQNNWQKTIQKLLLRGFGVGEPKMTTKWPQNDPQMTTKTTPKWHPKSHQIHTPHRKTSKGKYCRKLLGKHKETHQNSDQALEYMQGRGDTEAVSSNMLSNLSRSAGARRSRGRSQQHAQQALKKWGGEAKPRPFWANSLKQQGASTRKAKRLSE